MNIKKITPIERLTSPLRSLVGRLTRTSLTEEPKRVEQKIAVIGNMNNSPLRLVEGLRLIGHDAHLFINRKEILHRPESIYSDLLQYGYPSWMHDISDVADECNLLLDTGKKDALTRHLNEEFGLSILNDWAPSLAEDLTHPHISFLTGSDIAYYANFETLISVTNCWPSATKRSVNGRKSLRELTDMIRLQRDGIASSDIVIHPVRGLVPENDRVLDILGVTDDMRLELWPCCTTQLPFEPPPHNNVLKLLSPSRVNFAHSDKGSIFTSQDMKGTSVLLEGFSRFCAGGGRAELHLIEKGGDIELARSIISQYGLDERVVWHKEMTTRQLRDLMRSFDLVCDQFNASPLGLITLDAYAIGRPVLANFTVNDLPGRFPEPLPGLLASTAEVVAQQLERVSNDAQLLDVLGKRSREYAEKYLSCEVMAHKLINRLSS
jgi:glycosyltransferase involved in cell wall biosynthesis